MRTPAIPRAAMLRIGQQLRAYYDELTREPLPDRLADLIEQIKAKHG